MFANYEDLKDSIKHGQYRLLGAGSGRNVYDMDNGYVIKVGRNHKGLAQNRQENEIYHIRRDRILASIVEISFDNRILIMERAECYKSPTYIYKYYDIRRMKDILSIPEVKILVTDYHLVGADLVRLSSWGELRGRPVLVDYGYTSEVRRKYYHHGF